MRRTEDPRQLLLNFLAKISHLGKKCAVVAPPRASIVPSGRLSHAATRGRALEMSAFRAFRVPVALCRAPSSRSARRGASLARPRRVPFRAASALASADASVDHDDDDDDHDHSDEYTDVSSAHGSELWREFCRNAAGDWGGCCVEFDANGIPLDIPLRYVHGVGRVPAANMPFREQVTDWMTKCETVATDDGIELRTKRAMPEIGNEEAISSCGGSEWGEDVAYVEDEPVRVLRGADEDKTLLPEGAFSAGARTLPLDDGDVTTVQHCLVDPGDTNRRVRVVHRVRRVGGERGWETASVDAWREVRGECVKPFAAERRTDPADIITGVGWEVDHERSAVYLLMWPEEDPGPDAKDGGSQFLMCATPARSKISSGSRTARRTAKRSTKISTTTTRVLRWRRWRRTRGSRRSAASLERGLVRLPLGVWVYCGAAGRHDSGVGSGGDEGQLVLECGWQPDGGVERATTSRSYDFESGRLDTVSLARERRA